MFDKQRQYYQIVLYLSAYSQMLMTLVCGFIQLYVPLGMYTPGKRKTKGFFGLK
jgi:hypothetical protein